MQAAKKLLPDPLLLQALQWIEYRFGSQDKVEFSLDYDVTCLEGYPPASIVGNLNVLVSGELKNRNSYIKQ